jgi:hypothetical protein
MLLMIIFVELRVVAGRSESGQVAHRSSLDGRAVPWPWEERHGQCMAWVWHGKCESDTAALCKSNGKDTF